MHGVQGVDGLGAFEGKNMEKEERELRNVARELIEAALQAQELWTLDELEEYTEILRRLDDEKGND